MGKEQVLREVREAERRVREMLEEAERERDQKQAQARREADRIVREGLSQVDKEVDGVYEKANEETRRLVGTRIEQGREAVERDRHDAQGRSPQAVDRLVQELERSVVQG